MNEQYMRFPTGASEEKLAHWFGLHWDKYSQDWEIVTSDPSRIRDFIKVYQTELTEDDDKFTLMGLIVSSFDDGIREADQDLKDLWKICHTILEKECFLHYSIIHYWSLLKNEFEDTFDITPLMREIWDKVKFNFI